MNKLILLFLLFSSAIFSQTIEEKVAFTNKAIREKDTLNMIKYAEEFLVYSKEHQTDIKYLSFLIIYTDLYFNLGDYQKALEIDLSILDIKKNIYGIENKSYLTTYSNIAFNYYKLNNFHKSIEISIECLKLQEKILGLYDINYLNTRDNLADSYNEIGNFSKSIEINIKSLNLKKSVFTAEHPSYLKTLNNLAVNYSNLSNYTKSLEVNFECLKIKEKVLGKEHPQYIITLDGLAGNYYDLGDFNKSLIFRKKHKQLTQKVFGKTHPNYLSSLRNLALNYSQLGNYEMAIELNFERLNIAEELYGKEHIQYISSLRSLAFGFSELKNYKKALELNLENLKLCEKVFGKEHLEYISSLRSLAIGFSELKNYKKALELNLENLKLCEKVFGKEHLEYEYIISRIASNYNALGEFNKSLEYHSKYLKLIEQRYGKEHPEFILSLFELAADYLNIGDYNKALELGIACSKIQNKSSIENISCQTIIARCHSELGNHLKSIEINTESLKQCKKTFGKNHELYNLILQNLSVDYLAIGNYNKALNLNIENLKNIEKYRGKYNSTYLKVLNNLATTYSNLEDYTKSLKIYLECLKIAEKTLSIKDSDYSIILFNLSLSYFENKKKQQSDSLFSYLIENQTQTIFNKLIGLNYELKEIAKNKILDKSVSFYNYTLLRFYENPTLINTSFNSWLNLNGLLSNQSEKLKELIAQSNDKALMQDYEDWVSQKMQLLKFYEFTNEQRQNNNIDLKIEEAKAEDLERKISKKVDEFAEMSKLYTFKDIQSKLKEEEAYVDIVRLDYYDFETDKWTDSVRYLVYVITKETKEQPKFVVINNGNELEEEILPHYLANNSVANNNQQEKDGVAYKHFWQAIEPLIKDKKTIYTVLGGVYNNINLGTLYNPATGLYLSEEKNINLINSGISFIQSKNKAPKNNTQNNAVVIGNPNFNANLKKVDSNYLFASTRDFTPYLNDDLMDTLSRSFVAANPLPGTQLEIENIAKKLQEKKWNVQLLNDTNANKVQLKNVNSPKVLHLATHGYFMPKTKVNKSSGLQMFGMEKNLVAENPLLRSGLLLAGANKTLKGDSTKTNDNGIFTAYEASFLKLTNTDLVVLSACETGKGDNKSGEGVYGLRKSFADAGAKNIIMSLWVVDDKVTQEFMTTFYNFWLNGTSIRSAFNQTQNYIKHKYPQPYYWGAFVLVGE